MTVDSIVDPETIQHHPQMHS